MRKVLTNFFQKYNLGYIRQLFKLFLIVKYYCLVADINDQKIEFIT